MYYKFKDGGLDWSSSCTAPPLFLFPFTHVFVPLTNQMPIDTPKEPDVNDSTERMGGPGRLQHHRNSMLTLLMEQVSRPMQRGPDA